MWVSKARDWSLVHDRLCLCDHYSESQSTCKLCHQHNERGMKEAKQQAAYQSTITRVAAVVEISECRRHRRSNAAYSRTNAKRRLYQWRRQDFVTGRKWLRYGSIGGLEYEVPQSRLYCLCTINVALCSTALQCICRVIRRSFMTMKAHTYPVLHNFWTSTHRGKLPPPSPWRRHWSIRRYFTIAPSYNRAA